MAFPAGTSSKADRSRSKAPLQNWIVDMLWHFVEWGSRSKSPEVGACLVDAFKKMQRLVPRMPRMFGYLKLFVW